MAYSLYDAAVTPCAQQLGALAGIIDMAAAHCATNKIEESALLQDRLYVSADKGIDDLTGRDAQRQRRMGILLWNFHSFASPANEAKIFTRL